MRSDPRPASCLIPRQWPVCFHHRPDRRLIPWSGRLPWERSHGAEGPLAPPRDRTATSVKRDASDAGSKWMTCEHSRRQPVRNPGATRPDPVSRPLSGDLGGNSMAWGKGVKGEGRHVPGVFDAHEGVSRPPRVRLRKPRQQAESPCRGRSRRSRTIRSRAE